MRLLGPFSDHVVATASGPAPIVRPPGWMMLAETRALAELGLVAPALPALAMAPRGDGHPVLVLPGFLADDRATRILRTCLDRLGHAVYGWEQGRNVGPTAEALAGMAERLDRLADLHGTPVSLVGWSLGGIFARELARAAPDRVRRVVTLAAPFRDPRATNLDPLFRMLEPLHARRLDETTGPALARPLPVPATAVYTRGDGLVAWASCLEDEGPSPAGAERENVEVAGSHLGLPHNPAALLVVADRLALAPGEWRPYRARGWNALFFPGRSSAA